MTDKLMAKNDEQRTILEGIEELFNDPIAILHCRLTAGFETKTLIFLIKQHMLWKMEKTQGKEGWCANELSEESSVGGDPKTIYAIGEKLTEEGWLSFGKPHREDRHCKCKSGRRHSIYRFDPGKFEFMKKSWEEEKKKVDNLMEKCSKLLKHK